MQNLNIGAAAVREVDLLSLWRYANTFPTAIELIQRGKIDFKSLVIHQFTLQIAEEALDVALKKPEGLIKGSNNLRLKHLVPSCNTFMILSMRKID